MPTVLIEHGYLFFFFSNEGHEPPLVHIEGGGGYAKYWLLPVRLAYFRLINRKQLSRLLNLAIVYQGILKRHGLNTLSKPVARSVEIWFDEGMLYVRLADGREVGVPVSWFTRLENASPAERNHWRLIGDGIGIHWEDLDEDISVRGLLD